MRKGSMYGIINIAMVTVNKKNNYINISYSLLEK